MHILRVEHLQELKRFRNGVFHFQKNLMDDRFLEFNSLPHSAEWIVELWQAMSDFFLSHFGWSRTTDGSWQKDEKGAEWGPVDL